MITSLHKQAEMVSDLLLLSSPARRVNIDDYESFFF